MCLPSTSNVHSASTTPEPPPAAGGSGTQSHYSSSTSTAHSPSHPSPTPQIIVEEGTSATTTNDKNNSVAISSSISSSNLKPIKPSIAGAISSTTSSTTTTSPYDVITIELNRKAGKGLGLSLSGAKGHPPPDIYISRVIRGGIADSGSPDALAHQILAGDQIIEVNGRDLSQMSFEDATVLLKVSIESFIEYQLSHKHTHFPFASYLSLSFSRKNRQASEM